MDLGCAPQLDFVVTFSEPGDPGTQSRINRDLKIHAPKLVGEGKGGSMVACVAYLDQPGWTVRFDLAGSPYPSWSMMVPEMKAAILRVKTEAGVALDACQAIESQPQDETTIPVTAQFLYENAAWMRISARFYPDLQRTSFLAIPSELQRLLHVHLRPLQLGFSRVYEDRSLDEAASTRLPEPTQVSKLRLDVAWKFWNPKKEPEEEMEGVNVEFAIKFFDGNRHFKIWHDNVHLLVFSKGEEILPAGTGEREADGVVVGRPDPSEAGEEEEKEEEEKEEDEEGEEGEGEEEDVLDENGEPVLNEDGEPVKKPKKEKPPPPPEPAEDPYEFKQRDVAFITLKDLPKELSGIHAFAMLSIKPLVCYGSPVGRAADHSVRPHHVFYVTGAPHEHMPMSCVEMLHDVAPYAPYKGLLQHGCSYSNVGELTKMINLFISASVSSWCATLSRYMCLYVMLVRSFIVLITNYEEAGFKPIKHAGIKLWDISKGEEQARPLMDYGHISKFEMEQKVTQVALIKVYKEYDDSVALLKVYKEYDDSPLKANEARNCDCARVQFSGEVQDTYFGSYAGDLKNGPGIYCFATSAFYAGDFKGGKREGRGIHLLPDGGLYEGELANDRFHGQVLLVLHGCKAAHDFLWANGKKDGPGMYWDIAKGCMRGNWSKGVLKGHAVYDQPAMHYEGEFVRGVPAGPCQFTIALNRTLDMPKFAASHILDSKPVLKAPAEYSIPPGSGTEPELDEEGQPIEDGDKPPLPTLKTGYEGLGFKSSGLPEAVDEIVFPPPEATPVPIPGVPQFKIPPPGEKIPGGIIPPPPPEPAPAPAAEAPPAQA
ncbi:hypothetical protein DUNSADRAFT_3948 [Dunaliella salina]|uniref:Uncharacterized protein n=1 Tax=Dunaliella salina TaxID=3046 RepID=A0ABQ7H7U7_DUNSA|nr:hypothetical protein DUNSADRAFT_3948 [Dunaliella salina]|eukprot:KAF5842921.1 hypothetical protein DUNSADRAFT_3948 [Dunaliella salina]